MKFNFYHFFLLFAALTGDAIENPIQVSNQGIGEDDLELPLFDLATVRAATADYSLANKIGQGGFGPVYRVIFDHIYVSCHAKRRKIEYHMKKSNKVLLGLLAHINCRVNSQQVKK